ncbi:hypothetical protein [Ammoniphilus sp. 3BR4]
MDFLISGKDEKKKNNIVIVELKQWEQWRRFMEKKPLSKRP